MILPTKLLISSLESIELHDQLSNIETHLQHSQLTITLSIIFFNILFQNLLKLTSSECYSSFNNYI